MSRMFISLLILALVAGCADPSKPYLNIELRMNPEPASAQEVRNLGAGPVRLVCMGRAALEDQVKNFTRNQLLGITAAARDGEVRWPCDDVPLPAGIRLVDRWWMQTEDGWWVLGQAVQYPGGSVWYTVDPLQASYGYQPGQYLYAYRLN